ncbi:MBL fold metallo-hydrolase [Pragia fontium]|uniref:7,8-dihydropterin-6-yl-methyl-4-(Beta-D-ribofuranosyl)aminobenzene 5'-phosphate synthase n=1 Tax=Pragia fontium DSM 5563 = ATCC 49100 TaxID=1122977 RepID=A0AAJ4WCJ8_9GAMM|nr:MBL fold metallo-hydrolase [Pragia fontium]AKJ43565.1 beta-lactamase [Pragia fontium]SFD22118.1 7,8-dihydropterin-6-yl-methyl-4-(beta-D-ribofuranosyl)aminobenzene 5'-phosphate synthase [Pragia fontium DSM 5563 = ATCC 49100]VEJ56952.1 ribonuclease Z [Pragia fontium]
MKLTVLLDNNTLIDRYLIGEPGVCYHIDIDGRQVLLDTGYSNVFMQNADILGIDLKQVDTIILSHGHNDHTWGLGHLMQYFDRTDRPTDKRIQLVAHPDAFAPKFYGDKIIGANYPQDCYSNYLDKVETKEPYYITDNLLFLGEIKRTNDFEAQRPVGQTKDCCGNLVSDYVLDDSALVYTGPDGLVVISGCSHSGICNIVDYAISVTGDKRVSAVIGGFHLQNASNTLMARTAEHLGRIQPESLYPCHCTDLNAKIALAQSTNVNEVGVGKVLEFA